MERHIAHLIETGIGQHAKQVGDPAPAIVLPDAQGKPFDLAALLASGPVIVTFYRGGWCPYCNLELKAYQDVLPQIIAAGASLVAISPEKPDDSLSTIEKNALTFPVLSDVGQQVGRAFGLVYAFTDELRAAYDGFKLDISSKNSAPGEWSLPLSATYVIGSDSGAGFPTSKPRLTRTIPCQKQKAYPTRRPLRAMTGPSIKLIRENLSYRDTAEMSALCIFALAPIPIAPFVAATVPASLGNRRIS